MSLEITIRRIGERTTIWRLFGDITHKKKQNTQICSLKKKKIPQIMLSDGESIASFSCQRFTKQNKTNKTKTNKQKKPPKPPTKNPMHIVICSCFRGRPVSDFMWYHCWEKLYLCHIHYAWWHLFYLLCLSH